MRHWRCQYMHTLYGVCGAAARLACRGRPSAAKCRLQNSQPLVFAALQEYGQDGT